LLSTRSIMTPQTQYQPVTFSISWLCDAVLWLLSRKALETLSLT
jgi:hypothetical protein